MDVGVIVPVRGPAPYLAEALASVFAEQPAEVVVVDDGSAPPVAAPSGARVVRLDARVGPAAARQAGLAELSSPLVALADADDVWEPGKLAAQVAALERAPAAAVCFGRATVVGPDGAPTGERWQEPPAGAFDTRALYESNPIPAASALIRREALDSVGGFTGGVALPAASDWELWLRLAVAGHGFVCEPAARIRYRRHPGGLTGDVARLAEAGLALHAHYAAMADAATVTRVRQADLVSLARGRIRERRWAAAAAALDDARALGPLAPREQALRRLVRVPGLRAALGRRDPYRP